MPSPDYAALFRAILESPYDDLPRLVLCDWLEEHGEEGKAKALRRAVLDKEATWTERPLPRPFDGIGVTCCGFIEHVEMTAAEFLRQHKELFEAHPITSVTFCYVGTHDVMVGAHDPSQGRDIWTWLFQAASDAGLEAGLPSSEQEFDSEKQYADYIWSATTHPTRVDTELELSRAAVRVGRKAAGLPPLPPRPVTEALD